MGNEYNVRYRQAKRDDRPPAWWLSTKDVQAFMQERVDMIVATLRKKDERYANLDKIPVRVAGSKASDKYISIVAAVPSAALEIEASNVGEPVPAIFTKNKDEDAELQLIPEIENFFKLYAYSAYDKKGFRKAEWQRKYNVSKKTAEQLYNYSSPRYYKKMNGEIEDSLVMIFLDPVRIFQDMLTEEGARVVDENYPTIDKFEKIRDGEYKFHITKNRNKRKKNKDASFERDVDSMLRRRN